MKRATSLARRQAREPPLPAELLRTTLREAAEHRVARRYDQATALYAAIEARNPEAVDAPYFLALLDLAQNRPALALPRLEALARRLPNEARVWNALSYARRELGHWRAALAAIDEAARLNPDAQNFDRPIVLRILGRLDEAVADLKAIASAPGGRLSALAALAEIRPSEIGTDERSAMQTAADDPETDAELRISLHFALGEAWERAGDIDAAFAAFAAGNALKRKMLTGEIERPEDPPIGPPVRALHPDVEAENHRAAVGFRKAVFNSDFMQANAGRGHHIAAPIFVVGMPRSGSTLIEQILSSHRRVQGLGESPVLGQAIQGRYPLDLFGANPPDHFRELAAAYFKGMHDRGWTNAPRFVDKMLMNYMEIGLIHLMLPKAVILHAVRNPADTCLSSFRTAFATGNEASYDLGDIGREYVRYREMMAHWSAVAPGRVVDVVHEDLVADPERGIRWLVTEACGLDWDPACLRFWENDQPVQTASLAQVREPIFTRSLERSRRYEIHLGPLFEALGPYAPVAAVGR